MTRVWRLLALVAVLLMPFGMTDAPAAAAGHHDAAATQMQHCPDQTPAKKAPSGFVQCTMACAAALPAIEVPASEGAPTSDVPTIALTEGPLHGLHPDTATPPPKLS